MTGSQDVDEARPESVTLEGLLALFAAHGDTETDYLRVHLPRFLATRQRVVSHLDRKRGGRVLDIGAHWLHQSVIYALDGFDVSALDLPATLDTAQVRSLAQAHSIRLLPNPDLENPQALAAVDDDTFDFVLLTEVLEHLAFNPVALWREIHRVMKPGARIVVTTPNYYALRTRLRQLLRTLSLLGGGIPVEQVLSLRTFAHHWKEYSRRELIRYFRLLSSDFECCNIAHTEEYVTAFRKRPGSALVLWMEHMVPPLRPDLYVEVKLARKQAGIALEPHW